MKILIVNFPVYYGGTLVLSALCRELRLAGYDARLYPVFGKFSGLSSFRKRFFSSIGLTFFRPLMRRLFKDSRHLLMPGLRFWCWPFLSKNDTIVIYPDVVHGNPLKAKHVMRYLMYHYKFADDASAHGKDDLFVAFREIFNSPELNPNGYICHINFFDSELYRQFNFGARKGNCYVVRKGATRGDLPKTFDGPVLDDLPESEKVKVLNERKFCYFYDLQTFYSAIAVVCGCIPIMIPEPGKSESDYRRPGEMHAYGLAWSAAEEQIRYAAETRDKCLAQLDYTRSNRISCEGLVEILEKRFGKLDRI